MLQSSNTHGDSQPVSQPAVHRTCTAMRQRSASALLSGASSKGMSTGFLEGLTVGGG